MSNSQVSKLFVDGSACGRRLDNFLISNLPEVPRSRIYGIIRTGQVRVNGSRAKPKHRLAEGDAVRVPPFHASAAPRRPLKPDNRMRAVAERVLYEDEFMLAVDKPSGIAVHAGTRHSSGLIEAMRTMRPEISHLELVHRLDKDTSGVLLLSKEPRILRDLHALWRREPDAGKSLIKRYVALVKGRPEKKSLRVELAQDGRSARSAKRANSQDAKPPVQSVTELSARKHFEQCSLVDMFLYTGRTHQARQHACHIGHPIAGDRKYGERDFNEQMRQAGLRRMFLHASQLRFDHPRSGETVDIRCELPGDLDSVLDRLAQKSCE